MTLPKKVQMKTRKLAWNWNILVSVCREKLQEILPSALRRVRSLESEDWPDTEKSVLQMELWDCIHQRAV